MFVCVGRPGEVGSGSRPLRLSAAVRGSVYDLDPDLSRYRGWTAAPSPLRPYRRADTGISCNEYAMNINGDMCLFHLLLNISVRANAGSLCYKQPPLFISMFPQFNLPFSEHGCICGSVIVIGKTHYQLSAKGRSPSSVSLPSLNSFFMPST